MSRHRVGLLGLGIAGMAHYTALWEHADVEIVAVCRRNRAALDEFCDMHGIPRGYTSVEELLRTERRLDGVIVATPHHVLAAHLVSAMRHCRVVLVEKPMATSATEADHVEEVWRDSGCVTIVGYPRRYRNHYVTAAEWVRAERIGRVLQITCEWCDEHVAAYCDQRNPTFRSNPNASVGGVLLDHGSHMLDAILWLSGATPRRAAALMREAAPGIDVQTQLTIEFTNDNGMLCAALYASPPALKRRLITITGTQGRIEIDDRSASLNGTPHDEHREFNRSRVGPVDDFVAALRGLAPQGCSVPEAARVVRTIHAAYIDAKRFGSDHEVKAS